MAGIGFELKKLFRDKGVFNNIRAYLYSTVVSVGPFILCTIMIALIQILLAYLNVINSERELFLATIVYAFIFSQIMTSGFSMVVTRFVSDKLYSEEFNDILPSFYGVAIVCTVVGAIPAIVFYIGSPLEFEIKLASYLLYMELIIMWLQAVYLTALKDYIKIVRAFLWGITATVILSFLLIKFAPIRISLSLIISMDIGIFIIVWSLMVYLKSFFIESSKKYFLFLGYFKRCSSLFFINLFYVVGLYIHNFLFWGSGLSVVVAKTYLYAPIYDVPTFYAYLSIIPAMVIFVVAVETSFYDKYRDYYFAITHGGNYRDIEDGRKDMLHVLKIEMSNLMQLQLFFTIIALVLGNIFIARLGLTQLSIDIFDILVLGAYVNIMMFIVILIQLYFEYRKGALITSSVFIASNFLFTMVTLKIGEATYGLGLFLSALLSLTIGAILLVNYLKKINYHTYCDINN